MAEEEEEEGARLGNGTQKIEEKKKNDWRRLKKKNVKTKKEDWRPERRRKTERLKEEDWKRERIERTKEKTKKRKEDQRFVFFFKEESRQAS